MIILNNLKIRIIIINVSNKLSKNNSKLKILTNKINKRISKIKAILTNQMKN